MQLTRSIQMLRTIFPILIFGLAIAFTSCNREFDRLLKSDDFGLKYKKAFEYYKAEDYYKAQVLIEQVRPFYRGKPEFEILYYTYAYTQYYQEKFILASFYFKDFTVKFPNSQYTEEANYMTAYANYELSPSYKLDQTYSRKAIDGFQLFVNLYPNSDKVERCNSLIDEMRAKLERKALATADLYYKLKRYQAANRTYKNVLKDYPDTKEADRVQLKIIGASYEYAQNSIDARKRERFQKTIDEYMEFVKRYPESSYKKEAESLYQSALARLKK